MVAIAIILLWRIGNPLWIGIGGFSVLALVANGMAPIYKRILRSSILFNI